MRKHLQPYGALLLAAALLFSRAGAVAALPPLANERFAASYDSVFLSKVLNSFTIFTTGAFTTGQHVSGAVAVGGNAYIHHNLGAYDGVKDGQDVHYLGGAFHNAMGNGAFTAKDSHRFLYVDSAPYEAASYENGVWCYTLDGASYTMQVSPDITFAFTEDYLDFDAAGAALTESAASLDMRSSGRVTVAALENADIGTYYGNGKSVLLPGADGATYGYQTDGELNYLVALTIPAGARVTLDADVLDFLKQKQSAINFTGDLFQTATVVTAQGNTVSLPTAYHNGSPLPIAEQWYGESMGLLWNLPEADSVLLETTGNFFGHVLAPGAYVTTLSSGNMDGAIVAASAGNNAECHAWGFPGLTIPIDPVTPTPAPTPTETVSPSPSPTDSASPSPSPTDSASPSPSPTVTPTPPHTPHPTNTPKPSLSPAPTPEPTPTPEPLVDIPDEPIPVSGGSGSAPSHPPAPNALPTPARTDTVLVIDDDTPLGSLPHTGTSSSHSLLSSLGVLAAALSLTFVPLFLRPGPRSGRKLK